MARNRIGGRDADRLDPGLVRPLAASPARPHPRAMSSRLESRPRVAAPARPAPAPEATRDQILAEAARLFRHQG